MGVKLVYGDKVFLADQIYDCKFIFGNAMVAQDLSIDTLDATVYAPDDVPYRYIWTIQNQQIATNTGEVWTYVTHEDLSDYVYGSPISLYMDEELIGKFYVESISRVGAADFKITAISAIGLLGNYQYDGGVFTGTPTSVKTIIDDMLEDVPITYSVDDDLASVWVKGWLPADTVRECLRHVLFACGAAVMKGADGNPVFCFNQPETAVPIAPNRIYHDNSSVNYLTKYTKITVVEHNFIPSASAEEKCVFDNTNSETAANNDRIQFVEPMQTATFRAEDASGADITATAIISRHVNYVVINGFCKVFAKPYVDAQRQLSEATGISSAPNEMVISDATLVSDLNSLSALKRLVNYYKNADEINYSFVADEKIKPGLLVNITDPYDFDDVTGFIRETSGNVSSFIKADTVLVKGWVPKYLGNDYNAYIIIDKATLGGLSGTWTVPASLRGKNAYVVYFGGAQGGTGGNNGQDGGNAEGGETFLGYDSRGTYFQCTPGDPGLGGAGGIGGVGGKRPPSYGADKLVLGNSYSITLGAGGNGGAAQTEGSEGGLTTFNGNTSDAFELTGDYINIVDGSVYCKNGGGGHNGYAGGSGGTATKDYLLSGNNPGQSAINGGNPTNGVSIPSVTPRKDHFPDDPGYVHGFMNAGGGGAGGGSYNLLGGDAGLCDDHEYEIPHRTFPNRYYYYTVKGGDGGDGASPTYIPPQTTLGTGGTGGDGAGGGGGGGSSAALNAVYGRLAQGGTGGTGGTGGKGSDGFVIVYYQEA